MHSTCKLQEMARESSLFFPAPDSAPHKDVQRPKTSMGPPPVKPSSRPLQPSARHANANLYHPLKITTPAQAVNKKVSVVDTGVSKEVSLTSILKRGRGYESAATETVGSGRKEYVPRYKRRRVEIANPLYEEYKDCIEASHDTLLKEGRAALQKAHDNLTACVMKMSLEKEQQIETIQAQLESVLQPVDRMKMPDGTTVEVDVAAEIEAFKQLLAEEESNLEVKWDDWECLQEEIAMLGIQVLGEEVKDMLPEVLFRRVNEEQTGYKADSKKWLEELDGALAGPMEEVRAAGEEALKKFVGAEKESDAKFNQQKAKIVAAITMEGDD